MPQDPAARLAPPPDRTRPVALAGPALLGLVLLFGAVQLWFWTDRGIWIDEIAQLLNYPLNSVGEAFGRLPQAQQAAPPLFNLLLHAISGLSVQAMRWVMAGLTLGAIALALLGALGGRPLPVAAGLLVLLAQETFLLNATMLKFYAFDIAGFAIFAAWVYARGRGTPLALRDAATLLAGMLIGVSTIVGACVAVAVFLGLRLAGGQVKPQEWAVAALIPVVAFGYYLQIDYATEIQISSFPDAYGRTGVAAVLKFLQSTWQLFGFRGAVVLAVVVGLALLAAVLLRGAGRSRLAGLLLFGLAVSAAFMVLAAIGKYPAVSARHLAWILGIYAVLTGAVVAALTGPGLWARQRLVALGGLVLLAMLLTGSALKVAMKWPPQVIEGASEELVDGLAALPASPVLTYFGADLLIPLELARGAPITQHDYAPALSFASGEIDPAYFGPYWQQMDAARFDREGQALLRDDPLGWAKMGTLMRLRQDSRPLARFVLDAAPGQGAPFYIAAIHVTWDAARGDQRAAALRKVLDERACDYAPVAVYDSRLSPSFLIEARCP